MIEFDFITNNEFREALEHDYQELRKAFDVGAWKSVQVLAGSIIEAVLTDYLLATPNAERVKKDPLKMDLSEAIAVCRSEGAISQRTSELCSVIRSYRNLIHPGRALRLNEEPPNEGSASIAMALVDLIVADVVEVRQKKFGSTAKQILDKIERDPNCLPILGHLLEDVQIAERDKLFLEVLPKRYLEIAVLAEDDFGAFEVLGTLRKAYLAVKSVASEEAVKAAALDYVRVLKEGNTDLVSHYDDAFFRAVDIQHVPESKRALVKQHLLSRTALLDKEKLSQLKGIELYLKPSEVADWLTQTVRVLFSKKASAALKNAVRAYLSTAVMGTTSDVDEQVQTLLKTWIELMRDEGRQADADELERVRADLAFPF
jgi:hypothetical protein